MSNHVSQDTSNVKTPWTKAQQKKYMGLILIREFDLLRKEIVEMMELKSPKGILLHYDYLDGLIKTELISGIKEINAFPVDSFENAPAKFNKNPSAERGKPDHSQAQISILQNLEGYTLEQLKRYLIEVFTDPRYDLYGDGLFEHPGGRHYFALSVYRQYSKDKILEYAKNNLI